MSRRGGGAGAWLELFRASNAPTVVTDVLAGTAAGLHGLPDGASATAGGIALVGTGTVLVYVAGMVLNDAFDSSTDAVERPSRPIPSGRIGLARAVFTGIAMLAAGTAMLAVASGLAWAGALCALVLLYDLLHRLVPGSFLLMAGCRGCVPVIAALAVNPAPTGIATHWVAGGLAAYVAGVSLAARDEVRGFGRSARLGALSLPLVACAPLGMWLLGGIRAPGALPALLGATAAAMASLSAVIGILVARRGAARYAVPVAVGTWIGAIPLIDASACFLLGHPLLAMACVGLWGVAGALRPRIAAS